MLKKLIAFALLTQPLLAKDVEEQVRALLHQMTVEEKLGQLLQVGPGEGNQITPEDAERARKGKLGSMLSLLGAGPTNAAQRLAVEQSRLKIPLLFAFDVIHGYRTTFPIPLAESCSWNPELVEQSAAVAAAEAYAAGIRWVFAPMVDVARDPRWGRVAEGSGEDPYLGSAMAAARVRGFQGDDFSQPFKVVACAKHWVAYGACEGGRDYNSVDVSERALREVYFPPFRAAVEEGVGSLMSSFNDLSGVPASANPFTLTQVLRGEWKFNGVVISDYCSVDELRNHRFSADGKAAALAALPAGVDVEMVSTNYEKYGASVPTEYLDEAVKRVLRLKFRLGLFEHPYTDESLEAKTMLQPAHRALARKMAAESLVLLQNRGARLPLSKDLKKLAVIGPLADSAEDQLGTWRGLGRPEDAVTVLKALRQKLPGTQISYLRGCPIEKEPGPQEIAQAVAAARAAEATVIVIGEPQHFSGEANSRSSLHLPGRQLQLVQAIHQLGRPYVVVLMNGRPLCLPWLWKNSPAILEAWHPGLEGGPAIADALFGDVNPSGKLTMSFPVNEGQIPVYYNHRSTGRPEDPNNRCTSRYIDIPNQPQFAFGHGLSYTQFELSQLHVNASSSPGNAVQVSLEVKNTGSRAGAEVVQLYVRDEVASVTRPVKELKGFQKVYLEAGESRRLQFRLGSRELGCYDAKMNFAVEPGTFEVTVGQSSQGGLSQRFEWP
jgi:beta-glucosidase